MKIQLFVILLIAVCINENVYARTITGKVTNYSDGQVLPGVNIQIKGTSLGVLTNFDGFYSIDVPSDSSILILSYIGFQTKEIKVDNQSVIDISLEEDNQRLDEVVVIGYGVQKKSCLSASVISVTSLPIKNLNAKNEIPKTWHRSSKEINAVKLLIGDDDDKVEVPLKGMEMQVTVDGFRARVLINYYFYNTDGRYEGNFKIKLPTGASPYYFAFGSTVYLDKDGNNNNVSFLDYYKNDSVYLNEDRINEIKTNNWKQPMEAKVVPAAAAAFAFSETVSGQADPLLAEWAGADIFNCRVFPLESEQMHRVVIGYDVNLTNIGLDKVLNVSIPKSKCTKIIDLDVAKIEGTETSFSYKNGLKENMGRYQMHMENPEMDEIEIRYSKPGAILLNDTEYQYFASSLQINLPQKNNNNLSSDAVFMLDISASSNPDKFNVWLKLMESILIRNKNTIKRFNVLFFNIETFWKNNAYLENTTENVTSLIDYCKKLSLEGATDIGAAITEACNPSWDMDKQGKNIFLLSDGSVTWGNEDLYSISSQISSFNRIFVYNTGISGTDLNMLEHLSRESGGAVFSVTGEDEIQVASTAFQNEIWKIESVKIDGCSDIIIEGRPNYLFPGQGIIVSGRGIPKNNGPMVLILSNGLKKQKLVINFDAKLTSTLTNRVYGQTAVNQLESFDYLTQKNSVPYAVYFQVPGKTCSMLMLENENDYKQFNISLIEDSVLVKSTQVNLLINKALKDVQNLDGFEKEAFINQLVQLSQNPIVQFQLTDSLKEFINDIPLDKFKVKPGKIRGKHHFKAEISDSVLAELEKETPLYKWISDEADLMEEKFGKDDALKMLSTFLERNPGNADLARDVAYSALKMGMGEHAYYLFRKVIKSRPDQPHAYHALAQILTDMGQYDLAMTFYEIAFTTVWDSRFREFNLIVGLDYLRFLKLVENKKYPVINRKFAFKRLKMLESTLNFDEIDMKPDSVNLVIAINWNTDDTDIDLHVIEPSGEECSFSNSETKNKGWISDDVTEGFGTEMYISPNIEKGTYKVKVKYYADDVSRLSTKTKVYIVIYENWGKKNEKITRKVVPLLDQEDLQDVIDLKVN